MSARGLTADMLAAIVAGIVRPALLYEGTFIDGVGATQYLRLWTGVGTKSWDAKTWTGGGNLMGVSAIEEATEAKAVGFQITMSGMPTTQVALALTTALRSRNQAGKVWLMLFESDGVTIVADPFLLKRGKFSMIPIEDNGDTCTITAKYEDRLVNLQKAKEFRYTTESQKLRDSTDLGFEFVESLQDATFTLN